MYTGLEGIPGSGKSYEATVFHVLAALRAGRKVITNLALDVEAFGQLDPKYPDLIEMRLGPMPVRGTWDASDIGNKPAFRLFEDGHVEEPGPKVGMFGHVWDFYSEWKDAKGRGPLFVVDECHVCFPKLGTDPQVVQWFKLMRHFNTDVLGLTQNFRDTDQSIAALMHMLIRCRKADILGNKNEYIRRVFGGYRGGLVDESRRPYKAEFFKLYRSHTQSDSTAEAEAEDVQPFVARFKKYSRVFYVFVFAFGVWAFWPSEKPPPKAKAKPAARPLAHAKAASAPAVVASQPRDGEVVIHIAPPPPPADEKEPLKGKTLHITGQLVDGLRSVTVFAVAESGRRIFEATSQQLQVMGYQWRSSSYCQGWLTFGGHERSITCDAPLANEGSVNRPVVVDVANHRSSDPGLDRNMRATQ